MSARRAPLWAVALYELAFVLAVVYALNPSHGSRLWLLTVSVAGLLAFDNGLVRRPWAFPQPMTAVGSAFLLLCGYLWLNEGSLLSLDTALLALAVGVRLLFRRPTASPSPG